MFRTKFSLYDSVQSRSGKAIRNTYFAFLSQFIHIAFGLLIPRLILQYYGSECNGIIASVGKFISLVAVLNVGIVEATRAMFYKPLAEQDGPELSRVVQLSLRSTRLVAKAITVFAVILAVVYPLWISRAFSFTFTASLILILAAGSAAEFFYALPYKYLLYSDQQHRVVYIFEICTTILTSVSTIGIILFGGAIHLVKLVATGISIGGSYLVQELVKQRYHLTQVVLQAEDKLIGRNYAMAQGLANYVNSNVDVVVLTLFTDLKEVSVYVIYALVLGVGDKVISNVIASFSAAIANMRVKGETKAVGENMRLYELIIFSLMAVIYGVTLVLIIPFVGIYTRSIIDINYIRPEFAWVLTLAVVCRGFGDPYRTVLRALGYFKGTKNGAYLEAILNFGISVWAVQYYGLVGVAWGTLIAGGIRSGELAYYFGKQVLPGTFSRFLGHVALCLGFMGGLVYLAQILALPVGSVFQWCLAGVVYTAIASLAVLFLNLIFFRQDTLLLYHKLKAALFA